MDGSSVRFRPVTPDVLTEELVERISKLSAAAAARDPAGAVRVAIDGPPAAHAGSFATRLVDPLRALARPVGVVDATTFWRDASLRFEYGREDVQSYRTWLDMGALQREVLAAVGGGSYLPSLRDPLTNRVTRAEPISAPPGTVVIVFGAFLLDDALSFDLTVHLAMSPAARARRTPDEQAWTLPAFDEYDASARPGERADVVVRWDDPRHPAVLVE